MIECRECMRLKQKDDRAIEKENVLRSPAYIFRRIVLCVLGEKLFDAQQDTDALRVNNNKNQQQR